jgi:hypothetical protein
MLVATVLSLAFVPVFYAVIERLREGVQARRSERNASGSGQPTVAETH